jgi:hypothetical protein
VESPEWYKALLDIIRAHWKSILGLAGLAGGIAVIGATAYSLAGAVVQAQPAITQAIQISAYAIPVLVYSLVLQFVFQLISMIREIMAR